MRVRVKAKLAGIGFTRVLTGEIHQIGGGKR